MQQSAKVNRLGLPLQHLFNYRKNYFSVINCKRNRINAKKLVKFNLLLAEIFDMICRFLPSRPKRYRNSLHNFWGRLVDRSSQKIAQLYVAKIVPFNTCKSELRYSNPLWNASVLNKGHFAIFAQNRLPWQHPLRIGKRVQDRENSRKYLSFGEMIVTIGPVDPELIWLKFKEKEINASKIYRPFDKFAERAKPVTGAWRKCKS